jgi:hypothetical protein
MLIQAPTFFFLSNSSSRTSSGDVTEDVTSDAGGGVGAELVISAGVSEDLLVIAVSFKFSAFSAPHLDNDSAVDAGFS